MIFDSLSPQIDASTPEKEREARLIQAYLLHMSIGGRPKAFVALAKDMAEFLEQQLADCGVDDRPKDR